MPRSLVLGCCCVTRATGVGCRELRAPVRTASQEGPCRDPGAASLVTVHGTQAVSWPENILPVTQPRSYTPVHKGRARDATTLDFCHALDTSALPSILVPPLVSYGSDGGTVWRTSNCLAGHIQGVVVNGSEARWTSVTNGVPQGDSRSSLDTGDSVSWWRCWTRELEGPPKQNCSDCPSLSDLLSE